MRQIFLDTETTGLSPESGDRIIEIGCVEMVNRRLSGRDLHFFVNPERPNSEDAFKVHGLSDEFLADKPLFGAIADELLDYLAGAEIIIHNASFDVAFLNQELRRIGRAEVTARGREGHRQPADGARHVPGKSNSLDALCKRLEVNNANRTLHGALARRRPAGRGLHPDDARPGLAGHRGDRHGRRCACGRADRFLGARSDRDRGRRDRMRRACRVAGGDRQGQRRPHPLARVGARDGMAQSGRRFEPSDALAEVSSTPAKPAQKSIGSQIPVIPGG